MLNKIVIVSGQSIKDILSILKTLENMVMSPKVKS